ncbi:hypothetical protein CDL15_Pgr023366 [Punica granatum]|uniref:tRNA-uridine aminocarboxypropyltransferase n=1 Tax=Punica granatum TaxID=22663 RepID=A0A218Y181_PUNGR|nr:hypothetical protein CDL15_Pgr023366 [Punica granatum]
MLANPRAFFSVKCFPSASFGFFPQSCLGARPRTPCSAALQSSGCRSSPREFELGDMEGGTVSLQEWQGWGTVSPVPSMVTEVIQDLKLLEKISDAQMSFGGNGGKLQGEFKVVEDKKHRAKYESLGDSEKKLQFFSARQIACRLLGSRGYLCQNDFLRQNNTGKLLWQVFGVQSATLCLFGIAEDEDIMWNTFKASGKSKVWCLYPGKNGVERSVQDALCLAHTKFESVSDVKKDEDDILHFVLIDGTWSNSAAMFKRMKERAKLVWGDEDLPCISLATGASAMHKLRPQPSWDRTCTAAAAVALLSELQLISQFSPYGFDEQAEAVEDALRVLLEALTTRRIRMGRSISRKVRCTSNIC